MQQANPENLKKFEELKQEIEKAVNKALEVSKDNPYLLDAFHDELVDKYFHLLQES